MGDRGNIIIRDHDEQVCLYSHWAGSELPTILKTALIRGNGRWDDAPYLARIIFCEMVKDDPMGTTGFGISQSIHDGKNQTITVDMATQTVEVDGRAMGIGDFASSS